MQYISPVAFQALPLHPLSIGVYYAGMSMLFCERLYDFRPASLACLPAHYVLLPSDWPKEEGR